MNRSSYSSEEEYKNNILRYRERAYKYAAKLDGFLRQQNMEGAIEFLNIFQDEQFRKDYIPCLEYIAYGYIFAVITNDEINAGVNDLFIRHGNCIAELKVFLKKIEFLLWEMEFEVVPEAQQKLYCFLAQNRVSAEALKNIVAVAGMNKKRCFMLLSCLYLEHQKIDAAFKILLYGVELFPQDPELLTILIQLCRNLGMESMSKGYEEKLECIKQ